VVLLIFYQAAKFREGDGFADALQGEAQSISPGGISLGGVWKEKSGQPPAAQKVVLERPVPVMRDATVGSGGLASC
jgi:hypothetical protein